MNVVQKLFRSWEAVHPYNAAQALQIRGTPSPAEVLRAWGAALNALQLSGLQINCRTPGICVQDGRNETAPGGLLTPSVSLGEHLSAELNRPFADDVDDSPFRPFLLPDGENCWIGLAYRHCVADSVSIRMLLREWLDHLAGRSEPRREPPAHAGDGYWNLFAGWDGRVRLDQTLSTFVRGHYRLRSARKPATRGTDDFPVSVMLGRAPDGLIETLRHVCRSRETRLSDILLAALLETSRDHVPLQLRRNRRDVAVGCIVNLRPYGGRDLADAFGLFLGFTSIVCSPKDFSSRPGLLRTVQKQTAMQRRHGIAPACTLWVNAGLALGRFMPRRRLYHFYRKSMPLAAGLSSVSVASDDLPAPEILDYIRISPTGPMAPAVLSTTEMNGRLSLALTYRPAVISDASAGAILHDFVEVLRLASESK